MSTCEIQAPVRGTEDPQQHDPVLDSKNSYLSGEMNKKHQAVTGPTMKATMEVRAAPRKRTVRLEGQGLRKAEALFCSSHSPEQKACPGPQEPLKKATERPPGGAGIEISKENDNPGGSAGIAWVACFYSKERDE